MHGLNEKEGPIAQFRLERTPDKREVDGSSPSRPTTLGGFEISNLRFEIEESLLLISNLRF